MSKSKRRRPYDASRRQLRASESQERMLEAARRLFAERGYVETTLAQVADAAGVSLPTLYAAFQSKRGLLSGVLDRMISGQPGSPPLLQSAGARALLAETDPRRILALLVPDLGRVQERVVPIYEVMKNAARAEPDVAEMVARSQGHRYANLRAVVARLDELGGLRAGLTVDEAARTMWAIASPEVRQLMLTFAGWPVDQYLVWLERTLVSALLR